MLFHCAASKRCCLKPAALHGVVVPKVQDPVLGLMEAHTIGLSPLMQPIMSGINLISGKNIVSAEDIVLHDHSCTLHYIYPQPSLQLFSCLKSASVSVHLTFLVA